MVQLNPEHIKDIAEDYDYYQIPNLESDWITFKHPSIRGCGGGGRFSVRYFDDDEEEEIMFYILRQVLSL